MKSKTLVFAGFALAASFVTAQSTMKTMKPMMKVNKMDKMFMDMASHSDFAEMGMAKIALQKSKNPETRKYAQMMIDEHTTMNAELKKVAMAKGVMVPQAPNAAQKAVAAKLKSMNGMAFDKMYFAENVKGHQAAYALATKASKQAKDPAVRAHFVKGAPKIKAHLDMAKDDVRMMKGQPMKSMKMGSN